MSDFNIYLKVEPYLAQFIHKALGNPVELPRESPESKLIKRFLDKTPSDLLPDTGSDSNLTVIIPFFKEKDPRVYNYLSPRAKLLLIESFDTIFLNNLWVELGDLGNLNCNLTDVIYAYLEKHGIEEDYWETIRQKYYRIRKKYNEKGIKLG